MLRDMRGPGRNSFKRSSGIGLAYRFALQKQIKDQYKQRAGLFIAGIGSISALLGVFALCYGWYFLGMLSLFCAGCASQGFNVLTKMASPASKLTHQNPQPIQSTVGQGSQYKFKSKELPTQNDENSQANYLNRQRERF